MSIKRLAFVTILLTYLLIVFGGYVASSDSGMGCGPEWPKCNGEIVPVLKGATLIEYLHRVIGAILGLLSLLLFFSILRKNTDYKTRLIAFIMLFLLFTQILFGAVVVIRDLPSIMITLHLLIAMIFLALLIWLWKYPVTGSNDLPEDHHRAAVPHLNILLILIFITLAFGAYIKHESYGMACGGLSCTQSFFPITTPEILQSLHRGFAAISALYILILTYRAFTRNWGASIRNRLMICLLTIILQIFAGVGVIMTTISLPWAVLHLAIGTALFALISEARIHVGNQSVKISSAVRLNQTGQWQGSDLK